MADLSQGARFVEDFLEELIEEGRELTVQRLENLEKITDMLGEMVDTSGDSSADSGDFHARVVALFSDTAAPAE
ncbi:MAG: hypothetical protein ACD_75C01153G0001, partial [uncultured bacterium]